MLQVHAEDLYVCRQYREGGTSDAIPDETPLVQLKETEQIIVFQMTPMSSFPQSAPETVKVCSSWIALECR